MAPARVSARVTGEDLPIAVAALVSLLGVGLASAAVGSWPTAGRPAASPSEAPTRETPARVAPASEAPASVAPASVAPASVAPASVAPASEAPASAAPASVAPVAAAGAAPSVAREVCSLSLTYIPNRIEPVGPEAVDMLGDWLADQSDVRVLVRAHADGRGSTQHNFALSERRARWIRTRLEARHVARSRIAVQAFGEYVPIEGVEGEDERNRRTEVIVRGVVAGCPVFPGMAP